MPERERDRDHLLAMIDAALEPIVAAVADRFREQARARIAESMRRLDLDGYDPRDTPLAAGPIAPGTRGRAIVDALSRLGGTATVPDIARLVSPLDDATPDVHARRLREHLRYLALQQHGYVRPAGHRGVWTLTHRGRRLVEVASVYAGTSHDETGGTKAEG